MKIGTAWRLGPVWVALILTASCGSGSRTLLEVVVVNGNRPVSGVEVVARLTIDGTVQDSAVTDLSGRAELNLAGQGSIVVEALMVEDERAGLARIELEGAGRHSVRLDVTRDFRLGPALRAYERSFGPDPNLTGVTLPYDLPMLETDRAVRAVLELDRSEEVLRPALVVPMQDGPVRLVDVFAAVGIDLEVVWSDVIPKLELGSDRWPGEERFRGLMARYRNVEVVPGQWHLYVVLVGERRPLVELSLLIDPELRRGAVVQIDANPSHPGVNLHAIAHEVGHLLNLPHPWEVYGNTRSIMSYPWRWRDWDWSDPKVYRFDPVARRHLMRGPEQLVRPGSSPFSEYVPQS